MKVYTIIDTFNEGIGDEAYIVHFSKKEDALKFFDKYFKHHCNGITCNTSALFDEMVSNGYCWDYAIGNEIGHIFIRNEEVNLEFRDDILPFEDDN